MAERARAKKASGKKKGPKLTKDNVVELKAAKGKRGGKGDNSRPKTGPSPELIKSHLDKMDRKLADYRKAHEEAKTAKSHYNSARTAAKKAGINLDAYDIKRELEAQDMGHVQINYTDAHNYMAITKSPLVQLGLFDSLVPPAPEEEPPGVRGRKAGEKGAVYENPYEPGSEEFVDFDTAYKAAQAKLAKGIGQTPPSESVN